MAKRKTKPVDPDLAVWARLGGGVPESEDQQMSEGERIAQECNAIVREWLNPSTWRPARPVNPFRRD